MFIEEGRYKDIETFNIPTSPKSIRLVKDDMGSPELYLASSTNYEGMKSGGHLGVIWGSSRSESSKGSSWEISVRG